MNQISYVLLEEVVPEELLVLLNKEKTRAHLMEHPPFTVDTVKEWVKAKAEVNTSPGCKVRAVLVDGKLAGWCGIQFENGYYEIAIVIGENYWGLGKGIFRDLMDWAKGLGHQEVLIHFLYTRPEYKFLRKIAKSVYSSELAGTRFTTYELAVI